MEFPPTLRQMLRCQTGNTAGAPALLPLNRSFSCNYFISSLQEKFEQHTACFATHKVLIKLSSDVVLCMLSRTFFFIISMTLPLNPLRATKGKKSFSIKKLLIIFTEPKNTVLVTHNKISTLANILNLSQYSYRIGTFLSNTFLVWLSRARLYFKHSSTTLYQFLLIFTLVHSYNFGTVTGSQWKTTVNTHF